MMTSESTQVVGLIHRMDSGKSYDGTCVYLIRVSYFPKYGCNDDDKFVVLLFTAV
jgi:hypothetical protein